MMLHDALLPMVESVPSIWSVIWPCSSDGRPCLLRTVIVKSGVTRNSPCSMPQEGEKVT